MTNQPTCPKCGAKLDPAAVQGLCPRCLLQRAMVSSGATASVPNEPCSAGTRVRYVGDYELQSEIASGGMGVVYRARQSSLNRTVALKMILAGEFANEAEVQRFHAEAEAAAALEHPNIVPIYEIGEHEGRHFFSMQLIEGESLADKLKHPMPAHQTAALLETVARAIGYAHSRGVLHRDLKPANILLDKNEQPHITDFGLAKRTDSASGVTQSGAVVGTPSYMSPEQAAGQAKRVGATADVYGLGAILYHMLTGRPPFKADSSVATLVQVINNEAPRPRSLLPKIPADLETICMKCLEKKPERRYASAIELADDLRCFLEHQPIAAKPASTFRRAWTWLTHHPWAVAGMASFLVFGLFCLCYGLWSYTQLLQWQRMHPDYVRAPGAVSSQEPVGLIGSCISLLLILAATTFAKLRQRVWSGSGLATTVVTAVGLLGLMGVGYGIFELVSVIDVYVWEDTLAFGRIIAAVFPLLFFGLGTIAIALREYESTTYGSEPPVAAIPQAVFVPARFAVASVLYAAVVAAALASIDAQYRPAVWAMLSGTAYGFGLVVISSTKNGYWKRAIIVGLLMSVGALAIELLPAVIAGHKAFEFDLLGIFPGVLLAVVSRKAETPVTRG